MALVRLRTLNICRRPCRLLSTSLPVLETDEEYTATPQYPKILDTSRKPAKERDDQAYYDIVKAVKTVEEKQIKINMPKYYGFTCLMQTEDVIPYDNLELSQHITRTHLVRDTELPEHYSKIVVDDSLLAAVKSDVEEAILMEHDGYVKTQDLIEEELDVVQQENRSAERLSTHINRALLNNIHARYPHLLNSQTDFNPRIESAWFVGGMAPTTHRQRSRAGHKFCQIPKDEPHDRAMQYIGKPMLQLRHELPLPPIAEASTYEDASLEVPFFKYDPRVVRAVQTYRFLTNIPGFWPGDKNQFGFLSYHNRGHLQKHPHMLRLDPTYKQEALDRQAILASFGWLIAQANLLGFTTYNDLTYPLSTQTIITNGQLWSFYAYQLNTIAILGDLVHTNPKRNVCWRTPELKLYEEIRDGKIVGLNDDVLKTLIKFYGNVPEVRVGVDMKPYLSKKEKVNADYEDDEKRAWLEKKYKFISSNRPRHYQTPEIFSWEKIYKIDHKTRPMDKRRRFFELFENPYKRTLDEAPADYVPRAYRPDLPRHKGRYKNTYWP